MFCLRRIGHIVVLLTLVIHLAPHHHCMPISTPDGIGHNWWHTPCGPVEDMTTKSPVRTGGQIKSFRRTKTQLQVAHSHYKNLPLKEMYSEVMEELGDAYQYHWLPQKQLEWFMNEFGSVDSIQEAAPKVLYQLHKDLQKFAVTLDKLYRHMHDRHSQFGERRAKIIMELCLELRRLLCEVEESLSTAGKQPPSPPLNSSIIPEDKWDSSPDRTSGLIQDWGVLRTYEKFLNDWKSIVNKLLETTSGNKLRKMKGKGQHKNKRKIRGNKRGRRGPSSSQEEPKGSAAEQIAVEESTEERQNRPSGVAKRRTKKGGGRGERRNNRTEKRREGRPPRPAMSEVTGEQ